MLHALPITNVRLLACHEDWQRMTPTEQGRHCQSCQREVVDFTQASAAELAAARAASPDGRLCGHFRRGQLAGGRPVRFGLWARAFVLALALVFGQGLTARQAWAQTRQAAPTKTTPRPTSRSKPAAKVAKPHKPRYVAPVEEQIVYSGVAIEAPFDPTMQTAGIDTSAAYTYVEQMPEPPGGRDNLQRYFDATMRYPEQARREQVEGRVFVSVVVGRDGRLSEAQVLKGIGAGCDEEALRVVSQMPAWTPGRQNGRVVRVHYALPISFRLDAAPPAPQQLSTKP